MADTISTGGINPTASLPRKDLFSNIESATADIETAVGIIECLGKSDQGEPIASQISLLTSQIYQLIDAHNRGLQALRLGEEDAA
ncbi:MAG: hypothetical protein KDG54_16840 [Geminicoccaceae bacterium]|nr:hypothetical protein [Geminicoccaceae bacterium]